MSINREELVTACLEDWIDKGLTLVEMEKTSAVLAEFLEAIPAEELPELVAKLAADTPALPSLSPADAAVSAFPAGRAMSALTGLASLIGNKGMNLLESAGSTAVRYAPVAAVGGIALPYFAGRYLGKMTADNMDESSYAVSTLKDREVLQALREATNRIEYQRRLREQEQQ